MCCLSSIHCNRSLMNINIAKQFLFELHHCLCPTGVPFDTCSEISIALTGKTQGYRLNMNRYIVKESRSIW